MTDENLAELHLADLHERAAEAGVNGYRMLSRDELIAEIEVGGKRKRSRWPRRKAPKVDAESETDELKILSEDESGGEAEGEPEDDAPAEPRPRRRGRRGGRGRGGRDREKLSAEEREAAPENEETEEITGVLEITRQRHGFLSVEGSDDDIYVSASQVRRCEMKEGDEVTGPVRAPRRGERHRALVRVNLVNGEPPVAAPAPKPNPNPQDPQDPLALRLAWEWKKSGGGDAEARPISAAPQTVEVKLISVEGERVVIEIAGVEHELEPGDRLSVAIDADSD